MWNEKFLKVIPAVVFLFCLLEIFELVLIINDMNKTERLEQQLRENVKALDTITHLLSDDIVGLENFEKKHR
ncbi:hypothetical protein E5D84_01015 [Helicobacter pylori]|nr:hypothetical protein E5D84_01015 [Helicobacter pylori]